MDSTTSKTTSREQRSERITAAFKWPMIVVAALVIPTIAIENAKLGSGWTTTATILNCLIWTLFVVELVVLAVAAPHRKQWLAKHPLDVAIVLLTPPFGPAALQSARAFRLLRLIRLIRVAQLWRSAFSLAGAAWAALIAFLLIEAAGVGLVAVEGTAHHPHLTIVDGFWWAMTTVTTIGYGDIAPITNGGRLIAMGIMIVGLGFVAVVTGAAAQYFINKHDAENDAATTDDVLAALQAVRGELHAVSERLDRLEPTSDDPNGQDVRQRWTASSSTSPTVPATHPELLALHANTRGSTATRPRPREEAGRRQRQVRPARPRRPQPP